MIQQVQTLVGVPTHLDPKAVAELAIVIPVYKQPGLLLEALESVIAQRTRHVVRVVVVDDGCPFPQTAANAQAYAAAYPGAIAYLRRLNGGLSAARNAGVDFALKAWPQARAIYFLDADNRILPLFVDRAMRALDAAPANVGWFYPDIDTFGFNYGHDTSGPFTQLYLLSEGICEAGSLVRRRVFEAGVRFDESMKLGFEDWEFWIHAAEQGFRGQHLPNAGFQYRRRSESMLSGSERNRPEILAYIRRKHRKFFSARNLLSLEHLEMPRYCLVAGDSAYRFTDPRNPGSRLKSEHVWQELLDLAHDRGRRRFPPYLLLCSEEIFALLTETALVRGLLCEIERNLAQTNIVGITMAFDQPEGRFRLDALDGEASAKQLRGAVLVAASTNLLCDCIADQSSDWLTSIASNTPQPGVRVLRISLPARMKPKRPSDRKVYDMASAVDHLHSTYHRGPAVSRPWRHFGFRPRHQSQGILQSQLMTGPVLPVRPEPGVQDIGFILPLAEFGGVEKVALNYAASAKAHGFRCHLFIFESNEVFIPAEHQRTFESVTFLNDTFIAESLRSSSRVSRVAAKKYLGTAPSEWAVKGDHNRALGLLIGMDAVVAMHSYEAHGLMGKLRSAGVKTFACLHVSDQHELGYPTGHPLYTLPFEHSYDGILVISKSMARWCVGHGIPGEKILLVPNAPAYVADQSVLQQTLERRKQMSRPAGLNVLFLGRLDYQKGLTRLRDIVTGSLRDELPVRWRIVGKPLVHDASCELSALEELIEPPALTGAELDQLYSWADVVVLPSLYEGVPLTILEAQRFGCVVVATDVGAVSEVVCTDRDGILVDGELSHDSIVAEFLRILRRLATDTDELRSLSLNAAATERNWAASLKPYFDHLTSQRRAA